MERLKNNMNPILMNPILTEELKALKKIDDGVIGWKCERHEKYEFEHLLFFGLCCDEAGIPVYNEDELKKLKFFP